MLRPEQSGVSNSTQSDTNSTPRPARIALREDSATVALHVRTLLQHMGYAVRVIADAADATGVDDCDLAVIGVRASGADAVVSRSLLAMLPILALAPSSFGLAGASATISVPVRAVELRDAVSRLLEPAKVLDHDVLATIWGDHRDPRLAGIIDVFAKEIVQLADRVEQAFAAGDMAGLELNAHALKGAAAQIGTSVLRIAAGRLEGRVREIRAGRAEASGVADMVTTLRAAIAPAVTELNAVLGE